MSNTLTADETLDEFRAAGALLEAVSVNGRPLLAAGREDENAEVLEAMRSEESPE